MRKRKPKDVFNQEVWNAIQQLRSLAVPFDLYYIFHEIFNNDATTVFQQK